MRTRFAMMCVLAVSSADLAAQQPGSAAGAPLTLPQLEEMALANNPTVRQAQAGVDVARARARQAGAWPNPIVGYVADEITPGVQRGANGFFIDQTILLGGKLKLSRSIFEQEIAQAQAVQERQRLRIASSVRTLFYAVLTGERRVDVMERLAQIGAEAVDVTHQLFNVGAADQPDVLEANIEARRAQLALTAAKNQESAVRLQLAALVGERSVAVRPLAGSIDDAIPELERDATIAALVEKSPEIVAARAAVERAQAVVSRARRESFPDLFLRGAMQKNRELLEGTATPIGWQGAAEVGVSVPLFNRSQGLIAAGRAEQTRAETERQRLEFELQARAAVAFGEYLTALHSSEVYRTDIIPQAEQAYRLYLARYREMAAAYPQVLIAQRTLFEMTAEYFQNLEEAWRTALRLQGFLVGEGLEAPERVGDPLGVAIDMNPGGVR